MITYLAAREYLKEYKPRALYIAFEEAGEIWIAALGPDTKVLGEVKTSGSFFQEQLAATVAAFLGFQFTADHLVAQLIKTLYSK